jgi:hypothetical protein
MILIQSEGERRITSYQILYIYCLTYSASVTLKDGSKVWSELIPLEDIGIKQLDIFNGKGERIGGCWNSELCQQAGISLDYTSSQRDNVTYVIEETWSYNFFKKIKSLFNS